MNGKKLYRSRSNRFVAGVCGGLGEYFNVDPTLVRLGVILVSLLLGGGIGGIIAYIVASLVIPDESTID